MNSSRGPKKCFIRGLAVMSVALLGITACSTTDDLKSNKETNSTTELTSIPIERLGKIVDKKILDKDKWIPNSSEAYKIIYTSTGFDERLVEVGGTVFIPETSPPDEGYPVISWAHGTVGNADACAPSQTGAHQRDLDFLSKWLERGYAVVATDYEGLGTLGPHPYLHGKSQTYGIVDIVRAAQDLNSGIGRSWMVMGQSQGGQAALFAGAMASDYAEELDYRGTMAAAPLSNVRENSKNQNHLDPEGPVLAYMPAVIGGIKTVFGDEFNVSNMITEEGSSIYLRAQEVDCLGETVESLKELKNKDFINVEQDRIDELLDKWATFADAPIVKHKKPLMIGQGSIDTSVDLHATEQTVKKLEEVGTDVTLKVYEGEGHSGPMIVGVNDFIEFADNQFK